MLCFLQLAHLFVHENKPLFQPLLCRLKYVKNLRLEQIACEMHKSNGDAYSFDHINTLHGEALQEFDKKILNPIETPSFS